MRKNRTWFPVVLLAVPAAVFAAGRAATHGGEELAPAVGADLYVADLYDAIRWGRSGDVTAFNFGTIACNAGDEVIPWEALTAQHPVMTQNMYRLKDGRFEQIGMNWVKHGFGSLNETACGPCTDPGTGQAIGIGCSDPYSAATYGFQLSLGPRSEINPFTGQFPFPVGRNPGFSAVAGRLQVHDGDLDPALNAGARYFVEGHYLSRHDAEDGNGENNASYRRVLISGGAPTFQVALAPEPTVAQQPAIFAWKAADPGVEIRELRVPGEGRFLLGCRARDNGNGTWDYEYALYNQNSDRAANAFAVPIGNGTTVSAIGFHDVDYHSGEIYDDNDWNQRAARGHQAWFVAPYAMNPHANALRWGTLYNFRFTADAPPGPSVLTIGLFKPGTPKRLTVAAIGPQ